MLLTSYRPAVLLKKAPLVRLGEPVVRDGRLVVEVRDAHRIRQASLCFTTNSGPWQQRSWQTVPAQWTTGSLGAELPAARPLVAFLAVTEDGGVRVIPGSYLARPQSDNTNPGAGYIRVAMVQDSETTAEALHRMVEVLSEPQG